MIFDLLAPIFYHTLRIVGLLPLSLRRGIAKCIGYVISLFPLRESTIASLHLKAFGISDTKPVIREMYQSLLQVFFELINLSPILSNPKAVYCVHPELLQKVRENSRPTLVLTAHLGNWELLGAYMSAFVTPVFTMGKQSRNMFLQDILSRFRSQYGVTTMWRAQRSVLKKVLGIFSDNGLVAGLIDQDTEVSSVYVPFCGVTAKTPVTLIEMGLRANVRITSLFIVRNKTGAYEIHIEEIEGDTAEKIVSTYNKRLADLLRIYPGQWVWFHKRWRSHSKNDRLRTKEYIDYISSSAFSLRV